MVKQISVFLENKSGRLAEVTAVLGENGIDIRALSLADTTNFGILRLIVNNPEHAEAVLKESGYMVNCTDVVAAAIEDSEGSLAKVLATLSQNNVSIEYMYAFVGKSGNNALVVFKVDNPGFAADVLHAGNVQVLSPEEVSGL